MWFIGKAQEPLVILLRESTIIQRSYKTVACCSGKNIQPVFFIKNRYCYTAIDLEPEAKTTR
jgi:hypothetical protein